MMILSFTIATPGDFEEIIRQSVRSAEKRQFTPIGSATMHLETDGTLRLKVDVSFIPPLLKEDANLEKP